MRRRPLWDTLPAAVRGAVEGFVGGRVAGASSHSSGFSPGFASTLELAGGGRFFVKGIDGVAWPAEIGAYRREAQVAAVLPDGVPAPRLLGSIEAEGWLLLAFEHVDGGMPGEPWTPPRLRRALAALETMQRVAAAPAGRLSRDHPRLGGWAEVAADPAAHLSRDHPRLGGWAEVAADPTVHAVLAGHSPWALENLDTLIALERAGLAAAHGDTLAHFDLFGHNVLLTADRVWFVDWPHARLASPLVDLVMLLSSAASSGLDPQEYLPPAADVDGIIAAHTGFLVGGALYPYPPGLESLPVAKLAIGLPTLAWLRRRLSR